MLINLFANFVSDGHRLNGITCRYSSVSKGTVPVGPERDLVEPENRLPCMRSACIIASDSSSLVFIGLPLTYGVMN